MIKSATLGLLFASIVLAACGDRGASTDARVEVDTIGDTIVVRTLGAGEWGDSVELVEEVSIGELEGDEPYIFGRVVAVAEAQDGGVYVLDGQAPILRKYDASGVHVMDLGRSGGGPGEYRQPQDIGVLPDGRLVLYDPGEARVNVYAANGEPVANWPVPGGLFGNDLLAVDIAGNTYVTFVAERRPDGSARMAMVQLRGDGTTADTVPIPDQGRDAPFVRAQQERDGRVVMSSVYGVPFASSWTSAFSPFGYFITGESSRYRLDVPQAAGVLRIERVVDAVPVVPEEKRDREAIVTAAMRRVDANWSWNGPAIPDVKPAFTDVNVGSDGRIWVGTSQPGERIPDDEWDEPEPGDNRPRASRWRSPDVYDVFEPNGTYLGAVRLPMRANWAAANGDRVWVITRDELGVQRVVRYRIKAAAE